MVSAEGARAAAPLAPKPGRPPRPRPAPQGRGDAARPEAESHHAEAGGRFRPLAPPSEGPPSSPRRWPPRPRRRPAFLRSCRGSSTRSSRTSRWASWTTRRKRSARSTARFADHPALVQKLAELGLEVGAPAPKPAAGKPAARPLAPAAPASPRLRPSRRLLRSRPSRRSAAKPIAPPPRPPARPDPPPPAPEPDFDMGSLVDEPAFDEASLDDASIEEPAPEEPGIDSGLEVEDPEVGEPSRIDDPFGELGRASRPPRRPRKRRWPREGASTSVTSWATCSERRRRWPRSRASVDGTDLGRRRPRRHLQGVQEGRRQAARQGGLRHPLQPRASPTRRWASSTRPSPSSSSRPRTRTACSSAAACSGSASSRRACPSSPSSGSRRA